jgi:hypothetical protein
VSIAEDALYIRYAEVLASSVHLDDNDSEGADDKEVDQAEKEEMAQALRAEQAVLANRGAAIMCLMYLSASNGEASEMVAETLQLGIHLLSGGNKDIQKVCVLATYYIHHMSFLYCMASDDAKLSTTEERCPVLHLALRPHEQMQCSESGDV